MLITSLVSIFILTTSIFADASAVESVLEVTKKYGDSKLVEMSVEKVLKSELLGKETKHKGKIYLTRGKFRWENEVPERTLLVYDGDIIWSEQAAPKEFGGAIQVARGKIDKKTRAHILVSTLMGEDVQKKFKFQSEETRGNLQKIKATPLTEDLNVKTISLLLSSDEKTIEEIAYTDEIGNLTRLIFTNIKFSKKFKKSLFQYQPPKGAQVTDL